MLIKLLKDLIKKVIFQKYTLLLVIKINIEVISMLILQLDGNKSIQDLIDNLREDLNNLDE